MKKIVKRRKTFRVNNPLSFGILCAMIFILIAGIAYALGAGVVAPAVRSYQLANATPTPTPTVAPVTATPSPSPTPTPDPSQSPAADASASPDGEATPDPAETTGKLAGQVIGIDPARNYSSKIKGVSTNIYANRLNYAIAEAVKAKLEAMGATVVFTLSGVRDEKDSAARAALLNNGNVDLAVRFECNFTNETDTGAIVWVPNNHAFQSDCEKLGSEILKAYTAETGLPIAAFNGASLRRKADNTPMDATNAPTCMLVMGYISNPTEDKRLNDTEFQQRMADGVVAGILAYLGVQ